MEKIYSITNKVVFLIKSRTQAVIFLSSILSLLFIFLKLINIETNPWISMSPILLFLFNVLITLSAIFIILFMPSYPLFLILFRNKEFSIREKLGITFVSNLSYYIIIGFIGSWINLSITFEYFFFTMLLTYVILIVIVMFYDFRRGTPFFLKKAEKIHKDLQNNVDFSLLRFISKNISLNGLLLGIFIILICILYVVNTSFFAGTDVWLHISIVKYITEINNIPFNEYYGALGLHIFGAVIHFFSGIELILIPKYYMFYTIPLSSLIIYNILMRIFKNNNLAIFGVFLLVSSMGFSWFMNAQFWPSGIALIQGLVIFFILYVRLQGFIRQEPPKKEDIFSNMLFSYTLSIFIFISSFFTHSLLTMILVISYVWIYLIYFIKNYRRGFDFLLLMLFFFIFLIFYSFDISIGHFQVFDLFKIIPWYYLLFGALVLIFLISLILLHYRKSIDFTKGIFRSIIFGKKKKIYKKLEDKFIFPLIFGLTLIISIIFSIINIAIFNLNLSYVFYFVVMLIISLFSIWGYITFQYNPRGKPLYIWGLALDSILIAMLIFEEIVGVSTFFLRVFYILVIIIMIGFVSYFQKLLITNSFHKRKFKLFLVSLVVLSISASYFYDSTTIAIFNLKEQEVNSIQWYSNYSSNQKLIISKFGWHAIFLYYDYPFEKENKDLSFETFNHFILLQDHFIHPSLHHSNGRNILTYLKSRYQTEVILLLPIFYYSLGSWTFFDTPAEEEIEEYYNLDYLNRIFSAKGENGEDTPYYWVI